MSTAPMIVPGVPVFIGHCLTRFVRNEVLEGLCGGEAGALASTVAMPVCSSNHEPTSCLITFSTATQHDGAF